MRKIGIRTLNAGLTLGAVFLASCSGPTTTGQYVDGFLAVSSMTVQQVASGNNSVLLVSIQLENQSASSTVNNMTYANFTVGQTSASFMVVFPTKATGTGTCDTEAAWDVAPGTTKEVRMRLDLSNPQAVLDVACTFAPGSVGFDSALETDAARSGDAVPDDFTGAVKIDLQATLDPDGTHAYADSSASITPPQ
ncbi:MAG: hypothetical protein ABI183_19025 [Polyangiaceae bacterium]